MGNINRRPETIPVDGQSRRGEKKKMNLKKLFILAGAMVSAAALTVQACDTCGCKAVAAKVETAVTEVKAKSTCSIKGGCGAKSACSKKTADKNCKKTCSKACCTAKDAAEKAATCAKCPKDACKCPAKVTADKE